MAAVTRVKESFVIRVFLSSTILDERKTVFRYRRYNSFDDEGLVQPVGLDSGQKSLVRDSQAIRGSGLVPLALAQRGFQFVALGLLLVRWRVGRRTRGLPGSPPQSPIRSRNFALMPAGTP